MRLLVLALMAVLCGATARASDLLLIHARIYRSPDAPLLPDGAILIHDSKIVAVGPFASIRVPPDMPPSAVYDCAGMTITAGFWNSHVHLIPVELLHGDHTSSATLTAKLSAMFTRWGFTTVFDLASPLSNTNYIRTQIAHGVVQGPRILTVGEPFWNPVPIYVKQYLADNHVDMPVVNSVPQAIARVNQQVNDGADGIKIFAESVQENQNILFPASLARAIVEQAHRRHRLVFAHVSSVSGIELSLDSGVDILAHTTGFGGDWSAALIGRMKTARITLIPTLTLFDSEARKDGASEQATQRFIDQAVRELRAYNAAGGTILFGTDVGYTDRYDTTEEFQLMARAGMSFAQILASVTTAPAQKFGYASHSGRIEPGFDADLAVLKSDPAADINAFAQVAYTIRAGQVMFTGR